MNNYYYDAVTRHKQNPLTLRQVDDIARRVQDGDKRARRKLCDILAGMAHGVSGKFSRIAGARGMSREDLQQEAMQAMLEALEEWDSERTSFRNFAYGRARYAMMDVVNGGCLVKLPAGIAEALANGRENDHSIKKQSDHTRTAAQMAMSTPASLSFFNDQGDPDLDIDYLECGYEVVENSLTLVQALRGCNATPHQKRCLLVKLGIVDKTVPQFAEELGVRSQSIHAAADRALKNIGIRNRRGMGAVV